MKAFWTSLFLLPLTLLAAPTLNTNSPVRHNIFTTNSVVDGIPSAQPWLVCIGDSMTDRGGAPGPNGWVYQLTTNVLWPKSIAVLNMGKSGDTVTEDVANWDTRYKPIFDSLTFKSARSTNNWVIIWKGYNDGTVVNYQNNLQALIDKVKDYTTNIILCNVICNSTNTKLSICNQINDLITNNTFTGVRKVFDFQAMTLGIYTNFWSQDGIYVHPSENLCARIADKFCAYIPPLLKEQSIIRPTFWGGFDVLGTFNTNASQPAFRPAHAVIDGELVMKNSGLIGWRDPGNPLLIANYIRPTNWWNYGLGIYVYGVGRIDIPQDIFYGRGANGTNGFINIVGYTLIKGGLAITNGLEVSNGQLDLKVLTRATNNPGTPGTISAWIPITVNTTNFWIPVYK